MTQSLCHLWFACPVCAVRVPHPPPRFRRRTVMKTGLESVRSALRAFLDSAAEDLEKTLENLRQGQFTHTRSQPKGVTQIINYTTVALLPMLSSLFEHIGQHQFGEDLICM